MARTGVTHTLVTKAGSWAAPNVLSQNPCFNKTSGDSCVLSSRRSTVYPIKIYSEEGKGWGSLHGQDCREKYQNKDSLEGHGVVCQRLRGRLARQHYDASL